MRAVISLTLFLLLAPAHVCLAQASEEEAPKHVITEMQAGHNDKALLILTEVINKHPRHVYAYLLRSNLKVTSGDTYGALGDVNKAIQLKPEMGQAYHERAIIRLLAKDLKGAVQDLDSAISHDYRKDGVYQ